MYHSIIKKLAFLICVYVCVSLCVCVIVCVYIRYMCVDTLGGQKRALHPPELELQTVLLHVT